MNPIAYNAILNKNTDRHIQFDLSKNQTYIIDNDNYESVYDNIPFITILVFTLFVASTILAYVNEYYVYAGFFGFSTVASAIHLIYISKYTFIISSQ